MCDKIKMYKEEVLKQIEEYKKVVEQDEKLTFGELTQKLAAILIIKEIIEDTELAVKEEKEDPESKLEMCNICCTYKANIKENGACDCCNKTLKNREHEGDTKC